MNKFTGRYSLRPIAYRMYEFVPDPGFAFWIWEGDHARPIAPQTMLTDGATIPRLFWSIPGFDPLDWIDGAVIHDWLYEEHHRGLSDVTFEQANEVLAECLKTTGLSPWKRCLIMTAVRMFGRRYWNRKP